MKSRSMLRISYWTKWLCCAVNEQEQQANRQHGTVTFVQIYAGELRVCL